MKKILLCILISMLGNVLIAQSNFLSIYGTITDDKGEPISFANVALLQNDNQIMGTIAEFNGSYMLRPIQKGCYTLRFSFVGLQSKAIDEICLSNLDLEINTFLDEEIQLEWGGCILTAWKPLIDVSETITTGKTFTREEITRMPF